MQAEACIRIKLVSLYSTNSLIFSFHVFYVFETDDSSSGSRLYIELCYGTFYMHQHKQSRLPNRLLIKMHVKYTTP